MADKKILESIPEVLREQLITEVSEVLKERADIADKEAADIEKIVNNIMQ